MSFLPFTYGLNNKVTDIQQKIIAHMIGSLLSGKHGFMTHSARVVFVDHHHHHELYKITCNWLSLNPLDSVEPSIQDVFILMSVSVFCLLHSVFV
jgi:hypothetical protein